MAIRIPDPLIRRPCQPTLFPIPRIAERIANQGARLCNLYPAVFVPLFTGLKYLLPVAMVAVPLIGALTSMKVTYIALATLAIFSCWFLVSLTLARVSTHRSNEQLSRSGMQRPLEGAVSRPIPSAGVEPQTSNNRAALRPASTERALPTLQTAVGLEAGGSNPREEEGRALRLAAMDGDTATVVALITSGVNVDAPDEHGSTALMLAALRGLMDMVVVLVQHGANINAPGRWGKTALMQLVQSRAPIGNITVLVTLGAGVDIPDRNRVTPVAWAVENGHIDTVRELVRLGASFYASDYLMRVVMDNRPEMLRELVRLGANINASQRALADLFYTAMGYGNREIVETLLELTGGAVPAERRGEVEAFMRRDT